MAITLGEILQWDILKNAHIIADTFDRQTVIENITIMEAPDIGRWVDGNNIVLTSLYSIYEDKRKIAEFISSLRSGRVCALFVKVNRFVDQVPAAIIQACRELHIAVLEFPAHIRYIDVMYPVIASIFDSQVVQLSYSKQTLSALTGPALSNMGIAQIARAFAGIVKNPVALYDSEMRCICTTDDALSLWTERIVTEEKSFGDWEYTRSQTTFAGFDEPISQVMVPIRVFGQAKAYLSVTEQSKPMGELDFIAMENAVTVFSFELVKDFAEEEVGNRFKAELVEDIQLSRNVDTFKDRLTAIGLSAGARYHIYLVEMPTNPISRTPAIVKQQLVSQREDRVYDNFLLVKKNLRLRGFESRQGNLITVFIEQPGASREMCENALETLSRELLQRVQTAIPDFPLNIGYTSLFSDITQAAQPYQNARDALHISRMLYGENSYCNYEKLGIYKILCTIREKKELEYYVPDSIRALEAYEQSSNLPLLETLGSYFENNHNIQQTSKALFLHYKTLQYRLNKIQSVAKVDLKNHMHAFEMEMGLAILRMLGR